MTGIMGGHFIEQRLQSMITFDCHYEGVLIEQGSRQASWSRPDFDGGATRDIAGGAGDTGGQIEIEQEMLAEAFVGDDPVARELITKWRQRAHGVVRRRAASRAASAIASTMLAGSAIPWVAMSSAVP